MNISFENLGVIKKGNIKFNDLTVFCGPNNTGKTYAMYSLYSLLNQNIQFDCVHDIVKQLFQKNVYELDLHDFITQHFDSMIAQIEKSFHAELPNLFSVNKSEFVKTKITLTCDLNAVLQDAEKREWHQKLSLKQENYWFLSIEKSANQMMVNLTLQACEIPSSLIINILSTFFKQVIFTQTSKSPCFLLPAERSGMNLFFKELSSVRNQLLHHAQKEHINPMEVLQDIMRSRYAEPISKYIEFLNELYNIKKKKGQFSKIAQKLEKKILKGKYEVDHNNEISFLPYRSGNKKMQLHFTSSTVKTLFGLVSYLKHSAHKGDCLMIDEPELNLHPDNQRYIARILVELVNQGLKVVVSTHSSSFVRELNNLIMLNQSFSQRDRVRKDYGYNEDDILDSNRVSAYLFDKKKITPMTIDPNEGIIVDTFDQAIKGLNQSSNDIYYAIQEDLEESDV
ncbi:MAG: AAA family ATPase [Thiomargarita sp.]|nr:AAA family ATPase [Thiomargarita sp.]